MAKSLTGAQRRTYRTRNKIKRINRTDRPRLSVFRSNSHIHAQIIDDVKGVTVVAASTMDKDVREKVKSGSTVAASEEVGKIIAERAKTAGIEKVVFDRGSSIFHGRVKAVAEGARAGGLQF